MSWNDGYVSDIDYPIEFFSEQSPAYLNFACVLNGFEPIPLDRPFTYCELGFGRGLTVNLLAASNPQGRFYATDFMPSHVAGARQMAEAAQLDNLTLLENSFAELADGKVADLPQFDFVTMHGVYTWVNAENRQHIVRFLSRYLKPGGIVYISYNALPGWNAALPMQRLMLEYAARCPSRSDVQFEQARQAIRQMVDAQKGYFHANPGLKYGLESLEKNDVNYLVHEYLNQGWQPLYHADVVRDVAAAKLDYACSAQLLIDFPAAYLNAAQLDLLNAAPDTTLRETLKDYLMNMQFRTDVFVRGARRMKPGRHAEWLSRTGLALTVPRGSEAKELKHLLRAVAGGEDLYQPVFDALAQGPRTLPELAALPTLQGSSLQRLAQIAAILTGSKQAAPFFTCSAEMDAGPAHRINRVLARHSCHDNNCHALASPLLGSAVPAGLVQRLVYLSLCEGREETDTDAILTQTQQRMAALGERVTAKDQPPEADLAELACTVPAILERRLPVWRELKML